MPFYYNPFTNQPDYYSTGGAGSGDVTGPASSTDNAVVRFSGTTGKIIQNSTVTISDTGDIVASSLDLTTPLAATEGGTGISAYTTGDLLYADTATTLTVIPIGSESDVLTISGGIPAWASGGGGGVTSVSGTANRITSSGGATPVIDIAGTYVGQTSITTLGTVTTGTWNGTTIAVANGGTGQTTLTNHGVLVGAATSAITQLAAGSAGQVLQSGGASADPAYSTATYPSTATGTGTILRADGTNWAASTATYPNTATTGDLLYGSASNVYSNLAVATFAGVPLSYNGTNVAWYDPTKVSYFHDDFIGGGIGSLISWSQTISGTGASSNLTDTTNVTAGIMGMASCVTGTDTTGRAGIRTEPSIFNLDSSVDFMDLMWYCKLSALSDGTDTYILRMGYGDQVSGAHTDGLYFEYTHGTNSGNWQIIAAGAGTRTTNNTSTAATTDWTRYRIRTTSTSVSFYINGSEVANSPITGSNIPNGTGETFGLYFTIIKSAGTTSRIVSFDWISHYKKLV